MMRAAVLGLFGLGLAGWLFVGTLTELAGRLGLFAAPFGTSLRRAMGLPRASWGMTLAHAGLAVLIAGITASSIWKEERIQLMRAGDRVVIAGYTFTFLGAQEARGPNYLAQRGSFAVEDGGKPFALMTPERRSYPVEGQQTTEAAIRSTIAGDLYAVIGEARADGAFVTRLYFNPLVGWIWSGAGLMLLGATDEPVGSPAPGRRAGGEAHRHGGGPRYPGGDVTALAVRRLPYLLPLALFLLLAMYFWTRTRKGPTPASLGADRSEGGGVRAAADRGSRARLLLRRSARPRLAGQRLRIVVRRLPDRASLPHTTEAAGALPIYGIDWREKDRTAGPAWLTQMGDPYTLIGDDPDSRAAIAFGVTGAPESFVVDAGGVIRYKHVGPITPEVWDKTLWPIVRRLQGG